MSAGDVERLAEIAAGAVARVISHGSDHPDMETYARIHNEGWDAAMLAQVAPDPSTPEDWLAAHDADVAAAARREGAAEGWQIGHDTACPQGAVCSSHQPIADRVADAPHEEQP